MEIYGKKQIDIREDNKSAVIDLLLKSEVTVLELSSALDLSHTAIAKVIKELLQKNVVEVSDNVSPCFGRPPKTYRINRGCAIACAVMIDAQRVHIYYLDMRGFQINSMVVENTFDNADELIAFLADKILSLKSHPRLEDKMWKYIYVGIPTDGICGESYLIVSQKVENVFIQRFRDIQTVVQCNANYQLLAEVKYGALRNAKKNAMLVDFNGAVSAAFLFDGRIYLGEYGCHGYFSGTSNDGEERKNIRAIVREIAYVIRLLDIHNVIFSGAVKEQEWFMPYAKEVLGDDVECAFSMMGKNVPSALSGAVWQATYSTLMKVMLRE